MHKLELNSAAAAAKSLQSCPALCNPIDGSPLGSSVPGILQARILEWVAISFSNACMHAKLLQSCPFNSEVWAFNHWSQLKLHNQRNKLHEGKIYIPKCLHSFNRCIFECLLSAAHYAKCCGYPGEQAIFYVIYILVVLTNQWDKQINQRITIVCI